MFIECLLCATYTSRYGKKSSFKNVTLPMEFTFNWEGANNNEINKYTVCRVLIDRQWKETQSQERVGAGKEVDSFL